MIFLVGATILVVGFLVSFALSVRWPPLWWQEYRRWWHRDGGPQ